MVWASNWGLGWYSWCWYSFPTSVCKVWRKFWSIYWDRQCNCCNSYAVKYCWNLLCIMCPLYTPSPLYYMPTVLHMLCIYAVYYVPSLYTQPSLLYAHCTPYAVYYVQRYQLEASMCAAEEWRRIIPICRRKESVVKNRKECISSKNCITHCLCRGI